MKLFAFLAVAAFAEDKKVPPKTPEQRMDQLKSHVSRLMVDHFSECSKIDAWEGKLLKVCDRALKAYNRVARECSFFDPNAPNGGPGPAEEGDEAGDDTRYSETDAVASIKGITSGIRKWSQRYLAECGGQKNHAHLVNHATKWRNKLIEKAEQGC